MQVEKVESFFYALKGINPSIGDMDVLEAMRP